MDPRWVFRLRPVVSSPGIVLFLDWDKAAGCGRWESSFQMPKIYGFRPRSHGTQFVFKKNILLQLLPWWLCKLLHLVGLWISSVCGDHDFWPPTWDCHDEVVEEAQRRSETTTKPDNTVSLQPTNVPWISMLRTDSHLGSRATVQELRPTTRFYTSTGGAGFLPSTTPSNLGVGSSSFQIRFCSSFIS